MRSIYLMIALAVTLHACQPDGYKSVGTPVTPLPSLAGTWKLNKVTQTDEDAKNKGLTYDQIDIQQADITTLFPFSDFKLTLTLDTGKPGTFTTVPGSSPKVIRLSSGKWFSDDPVYPQVLSLYSGTDTVKITLAAYPSASSPVLTTVVNKYQASTVGTASPKLLVSYRYEFVKQ